MVGSTLFDCDIPDEYDNGHTRIGRVINSKGQIIGLYENVSSLFKFTLRCNGVNVRQFKSIDIANREYNKLAR